MAGKPRIEINYDIVYQSNSCGPFKIIENMGRDERSRLFVKIKFLETGTEKITRYDIAMAGKINDDLFNIDFNKIYYSTYYGNEYSSYIHDMGNQSIFLFYSYIIHYDAHYLH